MERMYICKDGTCAKKGGAVFQLILSPEVIMDEKNMATVFCHRCGAELCVEQTGFRK